MEGDDPDREHQRRTTTDVTVEHFDVLIVGAGISGVGAAYHLQDQCPDKSFVVLEKFESFGGTWLTHTYPGIRSDSDLYTFGYRFKPWIGKPIATADKILAYMGEVIDENDLGSPHPLPPRHRVGRVVEQRQPLDAARHTHRPGDGDDQPVTFTTNFLWMCQGYYRHEKGYTPEWPGMDDYRGPHRAPADLAERHRLLGQAGPGDRFRRDRGHPRPGDRRRVRARHDAATLADVLRVAAQRQRDWPTRCASLEIPEEWTHEIVRRKVLQDQARDHPAVVRASPNGCAPSSSTACAPSCPRATTSRSTSPRGTGRGSSASRWSPTAICSRASAAARPRSSPTRSRRFNETGILHDVGRAARRRHHHHRDRLRPERARRHRVHRRRRAASTSPTPSPTAG